MNNLVKTTFLSLLSLSILSVHAAPRKNKPALRIKELSVAPEAADMIAKRDEHISKEMNEIHKSYKSFPIPLHKKEIEAKRLEQAPTNKGKEEVSKYKFQIDEIVKIPSFTTNQDGKTELNSSTLIIGTVKAIEGNTVVVQVVDHKNNKTYNFKVPAKFVREF